MLNQNNKKKLLDNIIAKYSGGTDGLSGFIADNLTNAENISLRVKEFKNKQNQLRKEHEAAIIHVNKQILEVQKRCNHLLTTSFEDMYSPSYIECDICGAELTCNGEIKDYLKKG